MKLKMLLLFVFYLQQLLLLLLRLPAASSFPFNLQIWLKCGEFWLIFLSVDTLSL
jgi:hypothetical protein